MVATLQEALDQAGPPPAGFRAWPINWGFAIMGPPQPIEIIDGALTMKPREIKSHPDWRVYFVPEDFPA